MTVNYILSDNIKYDLLICDDAGYGYAQSMGWPTVSLTNLNIDDNNIFAVDNRITADEAGKLENIIQQNPETKFLLKVVDPRSENINHPYYKFLSKAAGYKNTSLLSVYTPAELTAELADKYKGRFIHLPYPYLINKEVESKPSKNSILISGSLDEFVYPYRYALWKKVTRSWTRLFFFSILKHPGYAEINSTGLHTHKIIGSAYIAYLSKYKFMLLCPSRFKIELLKYNECAYAGCIPVGLPPASYPNEIQTLFLKLRVENFLSDLIKIFSRKHSVNCVEQLRNYLRKTRNPDKLNSDLKKFLVENPVHTS